MEDLLSLYDKDYIEQYGLGGWLKENAGNLLTTAAGVGSMFIPGGQAAGVGMMASGVGGMATSALTGEEEEEEEESPYENYGLRNVDQPLSTTNIRPLAKGGELTEYEGPKHSQGGISLGNMNAEVEGGEARSGNVVHSDDIEITKDIVKEFGEDYGGDVPIKDSHVGKTIADVIKSREKKFEKYEGDKWNEMSRKAMHIPFEKMSTILADREEIDGQLSEAEDLYKKGGGLSREKDYKSKKKPYPMVKKKDFAGGNRSYPIPTRADAVDALRLAGLHGRGDVRAKVYRKYPGLKKNKQYGGLVKEGEIDPVQVTGVDRTKGVGMPLLDYNIPEPLIDTSISGVPADDDIRFSQFKGHQNKPLFARWENETPTFYDTEEEYEQDYGDFLKGKRKFAKGGLTEGKAKRMLEEGYANKQPLTPKQKRYFGYIAGGGTPKKQKGGELTEKQRELKGRLYNFLWEDYSGNTPWYRKAYPGQSSFGEKEDVPEGISKDELYDYMDYALEFTPETRGLGPKDMGATKVSWDDYLKHEESQKAKVKNQFQEQQWPPVKKKAKGGKFTFEDAMGLAPIVGSAIGFGRNLREKPEEVDYPRASYEEVSPVLLDSTQDVENVRDVYGTAERQLKQSDPRGWQRRRIGLSTAESKDVSNVRNKIQQQNAAIRNKVAQQNARNKLYTDRINTQIGMREADAEAANRAMDRTTEDMFLNQMFTQAGQWARDRKLAKANKRYNERWFDLIEGEGKDEITGQEEIPSTGKTWGSDYSFETEGYGNEPFGTDIGAGRTAQDFLGRGYNRDFNYNMPGITRMSRFYMPRVRRLRLRRNPVRFNP